MTFERDGGGRAAAPLAQPAPEAPPLPHPVDRPYLGVLQLEVDARDVERAIFRVREILPVQPGPLTLFYPKWLPGYHAPAAAIELLAGLEILADGAPLPWRRHPVEVHAFHVEVPSGVTELALTFQFLSPTVASQGTVAMTPAMARVQWAAMLLYPAGYFARGITIAASLTLPEAWTVAASLEVASTDAGVTRFQPVALDVLVDAPALAGRWTQRLPLDAAGAITLDLAADQPAQLEGAKAATGPLRQLIAEADALFGARHFPHYAFLAAVSDELGGGGVEHQQSSELVLPADMFTAWDRNAPKRDVFAHEYVHAWNGKFRRGADSWTPSFDLPIRNSLMWVYEGLTQYWGEVLAARSGLWSPQQARDILARTAALYANRPGGRWRPLSDTTRDPIIASRQPLPWPSWQRSEDYYAEGQLVWLDVDTLIRERSGDTRSLDDFARAFFGMEAGRTETLTYVFEDVVAALDALVPHDWTGFLTERLESREVGAPLEGLARGGYQLVYRDAPSAFAVATDALQGLHNLRFSVGLAVTDTGTLQEVIWEGPAYQAGLVAGATLTQVNGQPFTPDGLKQAIATASTRDGLEVTVERGQRRKTVHIAYAGGHRYPHLAPVAGARPRLDEILSPRA